MSLTQVFRVAVLALLFSPFFPSGGAACSDCEDESCFLGACACVPKIGCIIPPTPPVPGLSLPVSPIPVPSLPMQIQTELDKLGKATDVKKLGDDTFMTIQNASGDTGQVLQTAAGDTFATIQKAGADGIKTTYKAASDATATYVKAWRDIGEQDKRSFNDAVDAGKAAARFYENEANARIKAFDIGAKRLHDGQVIDAIWRLNSGRLQSSEENFAKATQDVRRQHLWDNLLVFT